MIIYLGIVVLLVWLSRNNFKPPQSTKTPKLELTERGLKIYLRWQRQIDVSAKRYGIPIEIITGVIGAESGGNPFVKGSADEVGLMQLHPKGALAQYKETVTKGKPFSNPSVPDANIDIGTWYLSWIRDQIGGRDDWDVILQAYNDGLGAYQRGIRSPEYLALVHQFTIF